ncbi:MAG: hypothetical protein ACTSVZ_12510 [Promethearchaeota archaeon]
MGISSFYKWLARSNIRGGTNNAQQAIMTLKIFNRQLEGQYKRMDIQGKKAYDKAKLRYDNGDKHAAFKLMRSALLYRQWTQKLDDFRVNIDDVQFQLSTAADMNNFDDVGQELLQNLCELRLTLGNPQIQKMLNDLNLGYSGSMASLYQDFIKKEELMEKLKPMEVRELDIRREFGERAGKTKKDDNVDALPDALGLPDTDSNGDDESGDDRDSSDSDDDTFDLEKELARLRKKRNG